ncbi:MAG: SCO family protein [Burkholderiales bacterium]|nr:SCO family protein [Burkholderiales bacterium]
MTTPTLSVPMRRRLLGAAVAAVAFGSGIVRPALAGTEPPLGWARPPLPPTPWRLTGADGAVTALPQLLAGRLTAVQLMFTGCTTSCGAQGLLFATMAARQRSQPVHWLSISIDALSDEPARLRAWQRRFGEQPPPLWRAAVPALRDVDAINAFLRGTPARSGTHTNQVFVFDRQGRLAYRTGDDPTPDFLEQLLQAIARGAPPA